MSTGIDTDPQYASEQLALLAIPPDVAGPLNTYLRELNENDARTVGPQHGGRYMVFDIDHNATSAGRYLRIVTVHNGRTESVHAFLEKATGKIIKPAGWAGPAKSTAKATRGQLLTRYTLTDPASLAALVERLRTDPIAWAGGYLYSR